MQYIKNTLDFKIEEETIITLGKFDGLHRGHELLMQSLFKYQKELNLKTVVFTFDRPPKNEIQHINQKVLTTNAEKHLIFERLGVDYLIECPFSNEVMLMEPEEFIQWIVNSLNVKIIVIGEDFCFAHNRRGNYQVLHHYEEVYGYKTVVHPKVKEDGIDISSTYVRNEIMAGHIEKANYLLGYEYFVENTVIKGNQLGRTIGFPTINLSIPQEKILPPNGVYASKVYIEDKQYYGVTNVGRKPTVGDDNPIGVETYIIDFSDDVYGKNVIVQFVEFIREEKKFSNLEALKNQLKEDVLFVKGKL